jgi:hypothetical protein
MGLDRYHGYDRRRAGHACVVARRIVRSAPALVESEPAAVRDAGVEPGCMTVLARTHDSALENRAVRVCARVVGLLPRRVTLGSDPRELGLHAPGVGARALRDVRMNVHGLARAGRVRARGNRVCERVLRTADESVCTVFGFPSPRGLGVESSTDEKERGVHERGGRTGTGDVGGGKGEEAVEELVGVHRLRERGERQRLLDRVAPCRRVLGGVPPWTSIANGWGRVRGRAAALKVVEAGGAGISQTTRQGRERGLTYPRASLQTSSSFSSACRPVYKYRVLDPIMTHACYIMMTGAEDAAEDVQS